MKSEKTSNFAGLTRINCSVVRRKPNTLWRRAMRTREGSNQAEKEIAAMLREASKVAFNGIDGVHNMTADRQKSFCY